MFQKMFHFYIFINIFVLMSKNKLKISKQKQGNRVYEKICEFCDKPFFAKRKHAKTCSNRCRVKLYRKGFSNSKVMKLIGTFDSPEMATIFKNGLPAGSYNFCEEKSGRCYVYRYTDEYVNAKK